jgi:membrane fusion protein, macrolide-specific efflux system
LDLVTVIKVVKMTKRMSILWGAAIAMGLAGCADTSAVSPARPAAADPGSAIAAPPSGAQPDVGASGRPRENRGMLSVLSVEHQIDLATERDGVVVSIARDEGSEVKKGDVLAQLDDRTLQIELAKARDDLQVAQNNVKYKQSEVKAKAAALDRQQKLQAMGLSSQADLEQADFEAKGAEYDMHGWEANAESSQEEIKRLEIELDQTRLRAPFAGAVVVRYVREGQQVAKGDKCFRVSQLAPLEVQFQVPETSGRHPSRGAKVGLSLVSDPNRELSATVVKISPVVDPSSDSYSVTAELSGKGIADLRPGMAVQVAWPGAPSLRP